MYVLIDPATEVAVGQYSELRFVSEITVEETKGYVESNFEGAQGFFLDHILYRISGRQGISDEHPAMQVIFVDDQKMLEEVSRNQVRDRAYIDYLSAMTGIDIPE